MKDSMIPATSRHAKSSEDNGDIESKIQKLEAQLAQARQELRSRQQPHTYTDTDSQPHSHESHNSIHTTTSLHPSTHFLLLLSDSALPLGSFAFSSGLESFLAHTSSHLSTPPSSLFTQSFLPLSLSSYASSTLPYVLAAHSNPDSLPLLDDALDAATICTVGRRASVAQGRALLGIWERSFPNFGSSSAWTALIRDFAVLLRSDSSGSDGLPPPVSAHLAPLFGAVSRAAGLDRHQTAFVFVLNHVKALVSAAVRRGMFGPYQAQKILASEQVREVVEAVIRREWDTPFEKAGQSVPVMDLWIGRHEMLYSRIFNS